MLLEASVRLLEASWRHLEASWTYLWLKPLSPTGRLDSPQETHSKRARWRSRSGHSRGLSGRIRILGKDIIRK